MVRIRAVFVVNLFLAGILLNTGCMSLPEYLHNGFKVGPNYARPPAPAAREWIDAADKRVRSETDDLSQWWTVFNDPVLNGLIDSAYHQNLSLRVAGFRVLEARAQLGITAGNLFPQKQQATGDFTRTIQSRKTVLGRFIPEHYYSQWDFGFNLNWELDFWGRFRRAVESDAANLDASVENYDDVLVTLLGDVATNYVNLRTFEERIKFAQENREIQRETLNLTEARYKAGTVSELDVAQARSTVEQTEALIPDLQISLRQANNQLCILLGISMQDLQSKLTPGPVPTAPSEVAVGIPADLLRRRPDVRRAERQAAAQSAQIGIAQAEFYPHIAINGTIGVSAQRFKDLFTHNALNGTIGPQFQWNILNYGRIRNNVRLQDAKFQELIATYQNTVLSANRDVENGLVTFLEAQERTKHQAASVEDAVKAVKIGLKQYQAGTVDFTRVTQLEQNLVPLQDTLAQARGQIALGLIQVYKALGGGWQVRCSQFPTESVQEALAENPPATPVARGRGVPLSGYLNETLLPQPRRIENAPVRFGVPTGQ